MQDNARKKNSQSATDRSESFVRQRLNALIAQAVKKPLTIVCAGMGFGKTQAVYDFSLECTSPVVWVQLSESDNISYHYWENFIRAMALVDRQLSEEYRDLGFPSTEDKLDRFLSIRRQYPANPSIGYMLIFDDFHLIKDAAILNFFEYAITNAPENRSIILISRELPHINLSSLMIRDSVSYINEEELCFTEEELYHYLLHQDLGAETKNLTKIYKDTKGWAFIINFVMRMLKKTPGYAGYVQSAIKQDILQLIESENWSTISEQLKRLFLQLSLTDHRSAELVYLLTQGNEELISELRQQNAFVRFDKHIDFYFIHHLFIDFLRTKQDYLTYDDIRMTYKTIADWCIENDFIVDALLNYEKIGDYDSIVSVLFASSTRFLMENVKDFLGIFERISDDVFDSVEISAAMHIQLVMNSGRLKETVELLHYYEAKYLDMPEDSSFRNRMLGCIYYQWAVFRLVMCTVDDCYDFDEYYIKACEYLKDFPVDYGGSWYQHPPGMWTCLVGSNRAGAPQEFLEALTRSKKYLVEFAAGLAEGLEELCQGELLFYQGNINQSDLYIKKALEKAQEYKQLEIIWRALFYSLRIAMAQGEYSKLELILKNMEELLEKSDDSARFLIHDTIIGWYYCMLEQPDQIPYWLREDFNSHIFYLNTLENYGNHMKAKYCYLTKNSADLLDYIKEKKPQAIVLYERLELLAMEACMHYKMKDKDEAFRILQEAYDIASPNEIIMPFIELGKDARLLITAAASHENCNIPRTWLKNIKDRVTAYSKNQTQIIQKYARTNEISSKVVLSPRETEILHYLCDGLSRSEIASRLSLSVNTIKVHINSIYDKLNAHNRADVFRVAIELNLL